MKAPSVSRLLFLDVVRALAVLLMVFAHVTDQLLDPQHRGSGFGGLYGAIRGYTAPLFFVVSGWSFAVVMLAADSSSPVITRRLKRAALLAVWGYALTLPWWAAGFPFAATPAVWPPFWTFGVLQSLAASLAVATLLWRFSPGAWAFVAGCGALALAAIVSATWLPVQAHALPALLRGAFDSQAVAGAFPLAPWAGFFFLGVSVGGTLTLWPAAGGLRAAVLILLSQSALAGHLVAHAPFNLILLRLGVVGLVLAIASVATTRMRRTPRLVRGLSESALICYVLHMVLLWGVPGCAGLVHRIGLTLGWWECLGLTVVSLWLSDATATFARRVLSKTAKPGEETFDKAPGAARNFTG